MAEFSIQTAADFPRDGHGGKRSRQKASTACDLCRLRKARCISKPSNLSCNLCENLNQPCQWSNFDGRKRRKRNYDHPLVVSRETRPTDAKEYIVPLGSKATARREGSMNNRADINQEYHQYPVIQDDTGACYRPTENFVDLNFDFQLDDNMLPDLDLSHADIDSLLRSPIPKGFSPPTLPGVEDSIESVGDLLSMRPPEHFHYYRSFGPTSLTPGRKQISVRLRFRPSNLERSYSDSTLTVVPSRVSESHVDPDDSVSSRDKIIAPTRPLSYNGETVELFDVDGSLPSPHVLPEILDVFFSLFRSHFPFLERSKIDQALDNGQASSFLINSIAALSARFCSFPVGHQDDFKPAWQKGTPFLTKAKEQLMPLLSIASPDVVAGLLILAWVEFGECNESGLWMLTGMAIRMAEDLGMNRDLRPNSRPSTTAVQNADAARTQVQSEDTDPQEGSVLRCLFWSVFMMDTYLSAGFGRCPSIKWSTIKVSLPTEEDLKGLQDTSLPECEPWTPIFPRAACMMLYYSRSLELLNEPLDEHPSDSDRIPDVLDKLSTVRRDMISAYLNLPDAVQFSCANFKKYVDTGESGIFIVLHVYFHMILSLLIQKNVDLRRRQAALNDEPSDMIALNLRDKEVLRSNVKATLNIISIADSIDSLRRVAIIGLAHCLYVTAKVSLQRKPRRKRISEPSGGQVGVKYLRQFHGKSDSSPVVQDQTCELNDDVEENDLQTNLLERIDSSDYELLRGFMNGSSDYYAGFAYVAAVLDEHKKGVAHVDLGPIGEKFSSSLDIQDMGLFRRCKPQCKR